MVFNMMILYRLDSALKRVNLLVSRVGVSSELRGWCWDRPPVEPPVHGVYLPIYELANRYCESMRDIYLRYVEGVEVKPNVAMVEGRVYHEVVKSVLTLAKKVVYGLDIVEGFRLLQIMSSRRKSYLNGILKSCLKPIDASDVESEVARLKARACNLWNYLTLYVSSNLDLVRSRYRTIELDSLVALAIPHIVEFKVDGTLLGLSRELSVDVFNPQNVVLEIKTGRRMSFHRFVVGGYALALESANEVPVNLGAVMYIHFDQRNLPVVTLNYHFIGDEIRRDFLELRDTALEIIYNERDPGLPPKCYKYCVYRDYCRGRR